MGSAGGPTPKIDRAAPAHALEVGGRLYIIDAGNGVARQIRRAGLDLADIAFVGITHHHSDHNADLGTLLHLAWCDSLTTPVEVRAPNPLNRMMNAFFEFADTDITTRMIDEGRPPLRELIRDREIVGDGVVFQDEFVTIRVVRVEHPPIEAYAYRLDTKERSFVISGDTTPSTALIDLAQGADVLVHEAIHIPSITATLARSNGSRLQQHLVNSHTSVDDIGRVAQEAGVKTLVVSHLVPSEGGVSEEEWIGPAQQTFDGTVLLAQDFISL